MKSLWTVFNISITVTRIVVASISCFMVKPQDQLVYWAFFFPPSIKQGYYKILSAISLAFIILLNPQILKILQKIKGYQSSIAKKGKNWMSTAHLISSLFILPVSRDEGWKDTSSQIFQLSWSCFLATKLLLGPEKYTFKLNVFFLDKNCLKFSKAFMNFSKMLERIFWEFSEFTPRSGHLVKKWLWSSFFLQPSPENGHLPPKSLVRNQLSSHKNTSPSPVLYDSIHHLTSPHQQYQRSNIYLWVVSHQHMHSCGRQVLQLPVLCSEAA